MPLPKGARCAVAVVMSICWIASCSVEGSDEDAGAEASTSSTAVVSITIPEETTSIALGERAEPDPLDPEGAASVEVDSEVIDQGPLEARGGHSLVWTGVEMVVWGGEKDETGKHRFDDGAAYNPSTGTWRMLAESPLSARVYHEAVWTGSEMFVAGGLGPLEAAAYDPVTDAWRMLAPPPVALSPPFGADSTGIVSSVWTGDEFLIWHVPGQVVHVYDPAVDSWRSIEAPPLSTKQGVLRWNGTDVFALGSRSGGRGLTVAMLKDDGTWDVSPPADLSGPEYYAGSFPHLSVVSGDRIVAWSDLGADGRTVAYDIRSGTWVDDVAAIPADGCEAIPEPLAMGDGILAVAWCGPPHVYDPIGNQWTEILIDGTGSRRYSIWSGDEVLTWGDTCCYGTGGTPFTIKAWQYRPPNT